MGLCYYEIELHRSGTQSGSYTALTPTVIDSFSPAEFDGQTKSYWYKARGSECNYYDGTDCGGWSGFTGAVHLKLKPNLEELRLIGVFPEFATEIGLAACAFNIHVAACAVARYGDVTDILLRKTANTPLGPVPGGDDHVEKDDVHFNKCGFARRRAYENLIHEAGHVLGILGGSRDPDWADSVGGHPTVPGSVMSYEGRNLRIAGLPYRLDDDPDCAPHPLDVMAIYALYQTMGNP